MEDAHGNSFLYTINFFICTNPDSVGSERFVNDTIALTFSTLHNYEKNQLTEHKSLDGVNYQVYNMAQLFKMNEELSAFYAQFDQKAVRFCGNLNITLYNSPDDNFKDPCTKPFKNTNSDIRITDFNKEFVVKEKNKSIYTFSDLLITGVINGYNPIQFHAKATSRWGVSECFPLKITMCGRETISSNYPDGKILNMKDYFGGIKEISYN